MFHLESTCCCLYPGKGDICGQHMEKHREEPRQWGHRQPRERSHTCLHGVQKEAWDITAFSKGASCAALYAR